jgi:hypothetical protein
MLNVLGEPREVCERRCQTGYLSSFPSESSLTRMNLKDHAVSNQNHLGERITLPASTSQHHRRATASDTRIDNLQVG